MADPMDKLTSEYNEAAFQIARLHNLWLDSRKQREKGDLVSLRWTLDSAEIELSEDIDLLDEQTNKNTFNNDLEKINKEVRDAIKSANKFKLYRGLIKKEKFLRKIQEEAGKGAKRRSEDDDGI